MGVISIITLRLQSEHLSVNMMGEISGFDSNIFFNISTIGYNHLSVQMLSVLKNCIIFERFFKSLSVKSHQTDTEKEYE